MQPTMTSLNPNAVTTDIIQQYLDENKQLILTILENQNAGKLSECAENQARLQHNLMYLAAIADSQPQPPSIHPQYQTSIAVQAGGRNLPHQQMHPMTPQSLMASRSSMLYAQPPLSLLQQQQRQQATLHCQMGFNAGGSSSLHMVPTDQGASSSGSLAGGFPDFGRGEGLPSTARGMPGAGKAEFGEGRSGQSGDGSQPFYLKTDDEGN